MDQACFQVKEDFSGKTVSDLSTSFLHSECAAFSDACYEACPIMLLCRNKLY